MAAVIALLSALLYVFGICAFWLQIVREYDGIGPGTLRYAASLVPRNAAAASGIGVIVRGAAYGTIVASVIFAVHWVIVYLRPRFADSQSVSSGFMPLFVPLCSLTIGLLLLLAEWNVSSETSYGTVFNLRALAIVLFVLCLPSIILWILGIPGSRSSFLALWRFYPAFVRRVITVVVIASIASTILLPENPAFDCLYKEDESGEISEANVIGTQEDDSGPLWTLQGGFVAKREGTWYVLTDADRLEAIPDDGSSRVIGGEYSTKYQRIDREGKLVEEPVTQGAMEERQSYVAVKTCSTFPTQRVVTDYGKFTVVDNSYFVRESTIGD